MNEYLDNFGLFPQALASKAVKASIRFINSAATLVSLTFVFSTAFGFSDTTVVDVRIVSLDHEQSKVTVSYGGNSRELKLAQDVTIEIDGQRKDKRSLRLGDNAQVTYDKDLALVTKILVHNELMVPAQKLPEGWDEIDQRLIFLMVRLANVEASLDAINQVLDRKAITANTKEVDAARAEKANEQLDRKGGGPIKWSEFYGLTAEKFFYHPTDRNTTYHTRTILSQQGSQADNKIGGGVPSSQGLPVHQRPPQFDYIYRANEKAKDRAEAEASSLRGKLDKLVFRRQRLEAEQAGLWVEVAFRAILHYDLDQKPLYRFDPLLLASDTLSRQRAETIKTSAAFMALSLSIVSDAETDQAGTFTRIKPAVAEARQKLSDAFLSLGIDVTDKKTNIGRFYALAKKIDDVSSNLTDSYIVAMEGDSAKDQQRKTLFRGQLQQSLLNYAQIVLAMDEMLTALAEDVDYKPNTDSPIQFASLKSVNPVATLKPIEIDDEVFETPKPRKVNLPISPPRPRHLPSDAIYHAGKWYWFGDKKAKYDAAVATANSMGGRLLVIESAEENDFIKSHMRGVTLLGATRINQKVWRNATGRNLKYFNWDKSEPNTTNEPLLVIKEGGDWHDWPGNVWEYFVVEWDKNGH